MTTPSAPPRPTVASGGQSAPNQPTTPRTSEFARAARSSLFRNRRALIPTTVVGGTQLAVVVADQILHGDHTSAALYAGAASAAAAGAGHLWASRRGLSEPARRHGLLVWGGLSVWAVAAETFGPGGIWPVLLWAPGMLYQLTWWRRWRVRFDPAKKTTPFSSAGVAELAADVPAPLTPEQVLWNDRIGAKTKALPGSTLTRPEPVPGGWRAIIQLPPGDLATTAAINAVERIASAYETDPALVSIEPSPDRVACHAQITLLKVNSLREIHHWQQSLDPATGVMRIGEFMDGLPAFFRLWRPGFGAVHSLIAGTTGAGKSELLNLLLAEMKRSGLCVPWLIDPQNGQSLPDWTGKVDWTAIGVEAGMDMLRAAYQLMKARSSHLGRMKWTDKHGRVRPGKPHFDPSADMPLLCLIIDEAHELLQDERCGEAARKLVAKLAKMGRKAGVAIILLTQVPSLEELGSQTLRSMLRSGNVICLRTGDRVSAAMLGIQGDPSAIPMEWPDGTTTAGVCYTGARGNTLMRTDLITDAYSIACEDPTVLIEQAGREAAAGLGVYTGNGQVTRSDEEELDNAPDAAAAGSLGPAFGSAGWDGASFSHPTQQFGGSTIRTDPDPAELDLVYQILARHNGPMHLTDLAAATRGRADTPTSGMSLLTLHTVLKRLTASGKVTGDGHGRFHAITYTSTPT